jgi:hypothetical protein
MVLPEEGKIGYRYFGVINVLPLTDCEREFFKSIALVDRDIRGGELLPNIKYY